ncbi:MAG: AtpZ/AtpI family protein [Verrucomicrobiota bacterium]|nr:AtpZ/AtpI family protein [Verrucomicrobiota bacterium]
MRVRQAVQDGPFHAMVRWMFFKVKVWRRDPDQSPSRAVLGSLVALGTNLAAGFALCVFAGYWIDHKRGTGEFWTLCGAFLGMLYMVYEVWKAVRAIQSAAREDEKRAPSGEAPRAKARGISAEPSEAGNAIPPRGIRLRQSASAGQEPRGFLAKEGDRPGPDGPAQPGR